MVKRAGGLQREPRSTVLPCQEWSVRHRQARSCRALQRGTKPREPPEIPELLSTWNSVPYPPRMLIGHRRFTKHCSCPGFFCLCLSRARRNPSNSKGFDVDRRVLRWIGRRILGACVYGWPCWLIIFCSPEDIPRPRIFGSLTGIKQVEPQGRSKMGADKDTAGSLLRPRAELARPWLVPCVSTGANGTSATCSAAVVGALFCCLHMRNKRKTASIISTMAVISLVRF